MKLLALILIAAGTLFFLNEFQSFANLNAHSITARIQ